MALTTEHLFTLSPLSRFIIGVFVGFAQAGFELLGADLIVRVFILVDHFLSACRIFSFFTWRSLNIGESRELSCRDFVVFLEDIEGQLNVVFAHFRERRPAEVTKFW